ncbi:MAG TPA: glycosyltransferase family 4 protein [Chthoniobacterales bacterium]
MQLSAPGAFTGASASQFMDNTHPVTRAAFVGDYTPRQCGIATFTRDLRDAFGAAFPECRCLVGAVNDRVEGYEYPSSVRFEIDERDVDSYRRAADFLNINNVQVVSVQHEFGIYGGPAGSHLLTFLQDVNMPVVTTLHTVMAKPTREQQDVMRQLGELSGRFVVMVDRGRDLLERTYGIPSRKIDVIPHGVPDLPFTDPSFYKDQFGVEGRTVLLTFGLLSPDKGIEYVIEALPNILERHPDVVYIVLGATHPNLIAQVGESYRLKLERLAQDRGVARNVIFYNRFVTAEELRDFIGAADIYITPYLNPAQITSGTLAYTFGAGKAVISTPYWHAQELLADDQGMLVPFKNAPAIATAVDRLLSDPGFMNSMRKRAWKSGRSMIWPEVAERYMESFERARAGLSASPRRSFVTRTVENRPYQLPALKLDHLFRLTDHTGMLQHASYNVPLYREGYCTDDNARAFILTLLLAEGASRVWEQEVSRLADRYMAFLWHAFNPASGRFRNFMSYDRRWLEDQGSEDSHARALWAAGTALGRAKNEGHRSLCAQLFQLGLPAVESFAFPRAWAFALLAIHEYLRSFSGDRTVSQLRDVLTNRLAGLYHQNAGSDWQWFEPTVTYDNARLSQAMILSGYWTHREDISEIGFKSLRWLVESQTSPGGYFTPVGCNGFWNRGELRARFDQQPLEANAMIAACLEAYALTSDEFWHQSARRCFEWFLGRNDLGLPLYDARTGGCRDGLHADRLNQNQGAESTLAFYLSLTEMTQAETFLHHPMQEHAHLENVR